MENFGAIKGTLPQWFKDNLSYIPQIEHVILHDSFYFVVITFDNALAVELALKFPFITDNLSAIFHHDFTLAKKSDHGETRELNVVMPSPVDQVNLYFTFKTKNCKMVVDWTATESEVTG